MVDILHSKAHTPVTTIYMQIISMSDRDAVNIKHIQEPIIYDYFSRLNASSFEEVSNLFSVQGCLYPPFEQGICGRAAIYRYLQAEAIGVQAFPYSGTVQSGGEGVTIYQIAGNVKTSLFSVNVRWSIELNADREIVSVVVKLLAELQELLSLKRG
jgi:hypothetical protein